MSANIKLFQEMDTNATSQFKDEFKEGKATIKGRMRLRCCTHSMEAIKITPGVKNWYSLSKNQQQQVFAEESQICTFYAQQSSNPLTSLYWNFGAQSPVWFHRLNILLAAIVMLYPFKIILEMYYKDTQESYGQLFVSEALYFDNEWWSEDKIDQQKQIQCITARTEHEKLGRDLIMLNISDNDSRMANERLGWFS